MGFMLDFVSHPTYQGGGTKKGQHHLRSVALEKLWIYFIELPQTAISNQSRELE